MKENKGKGLVSKETMQETHSQPRPVVGDKRENLSRTVDVDSLPSRRGHKKSKHGLSKFGVVKLGSIIPPASAKPASVQVLNLDLSNPVKVPSKPVETTSSKPPKSIPMTLLENEDLAWEKFQQVVNDKDIAVCYDMSLKVFEHSTIHDLFKVHFFFLAS